MRIVIIEDDISVIERLKLILGKQSDFEVVGSFTSAEEALLEYKNLEAHVILVDIMLPGMNGIELIRRLREIDPVIEMVAYTGRKDHETILEAIRAGASGYLLKDMSPRDIYDSLKTIIDGGSPISPKVARAMVNELQLCQPTNNKVLLSKRERDVLRFSADELSYKEIGNKLNISHNTVHTHLKNICVKLQVNTRKDAFAVAKRKSLI